MTGRSAPQAGQSVVPWFGGVYTRLDMTFIQNWDFSLQANNDSYFDWTGFARLTYRMGGSRRRNVPDQVEQPMMRNEHIVRAHQTPIVALNPNNGGQPWRVIHVNNAATPVGNGTAVSPFKSIVNANTAATSPWDIVVVAQGSGPYDGSFSPLSSNQYFIGQGSPYYVPTANCGPINIGGSGNTRPILTNPTGASINLSNGLIANNFNIVDSAIGISGSGDLTGAGSGRPSLARHIDIYRTDATASTQGVVISNATGDAAFRDVNIGRFVTLPDGSTQAQTMTNGSFIVEGGDPSIDFANGSIVNTEDSIIRVTGTIGGNVVLTANPGSPFTDTGTGVLIENASGDVTVRNKNPGVVSLSIASQQDGIKVVSSAGTQTFDGTEITAAGPGIGYAGVQLSNNAGTTNFNNLSIDLPDPNLSTGFLAVNANVINVSGNSSVGVDNAAAVSMTSVTDIDVTFRTIESANSQTSGVVLDSVAGAFTVTSSLLVTDSTGDGVVIKDSPGLTFSSPLTVVSSDTGDGIVLSNNAVNSASASFGQMTIQTAAGAGLVATNAGASNLGGTIAATGGASISANNADLDLTLASAASTNSTGSGLTLAGSSGSVTISRTTVTAPVASGINAVDNQPGFIADM